MARSRSSNTASGHARLIGAMRWDDSDLFPTQLSPKGALVFAPSERHALRLSVERAFLTPGLASLFDAHPSSPGTRNLTAIEVNLRSDSVVGPALLGVQPGKLFDSSAVVPNTALGNPHLVPQTVTSYEIGYKGQFGRRVYITLDAYESHFENFLTGLLPAGTTGVNPDFKPWTAPPEVPASSRAEVEAAVRAALDTLKGLTRLVDGTSDRLRLLLR